MWLVVASFLESSNPDGEVAITVLAAEHLGLVTMFLQTSNKTNVIFCYATFYHYINKKCYTFKGQAWEAEPWERATQHVVVQSLKSWPTLCDPMDRSMQAPLNCTISRILLKFMSIESGDAI